MTDVKQLHVELQTERKLAFKEFGFAVRCEVCGYGLPLAMN